MQQSLFKETTARARYEKIFNEEYLKLNTEQKAAVDHLDGPVLILAGPGTGKTQIIALRIGKILIETDTLAHNILCLTYTDAGSIAMRKRLISIIGPDAHKVHIHTFHSFCNQVIQENLDYFGNYRHLEPASDLEKIDVFKKIMDELPDDHRLKKLKGDPKLEMKRMQNLFSLMKKEDYNSAYIQKSINVHLDEWIKDPNNYYKRKSKYGDKGDLKQREFENEESQMLDLLAGSDQFVKYNDYLNEIGRYDFDDMILWVLNAFQINESLLLKYQERYHYFLVDEFQDTNGAQKKLLDFLISFWAERPNVFLVGDDDQAIYKFQGANLDNIKEFKYQYNPYVVVLSKNYRSTQSILDVAGDLINNNQERITSLPGFEFEKKLTAQNKLNNDHIDVSISSYPNLTQEQASLANEIERKFKDGEDLSETAILYRNHRQVEKLVEVLEKKGVALNINRKVDILKLPIVRNILNILRYIDDTYASKGYTDSKLFEIMHYNFFNIPANEISKMTWYVRSSETSEDTTSQNKSITLSQLVSDGDQLESLNLSSVKDILRLGDLMNKWIADLNDVTLQVLFQNILNEGQILNYILRHSQRTWLLQVLNTLFDLIKIETAKQPDLSLKKFLEMIDKMISNELALEINKVTTSSNGIHFITAHSSKGLEFDNVYLIGVTKNIWDNKKRGSWTYKYPSQLNGDVATNIEDERRLIYVAMTRARFNLSISYSIAQENGKKLENSQFVDEIIASGNLKVNHRTISSELVDDYQYYVLANNSKTPELIDHDLVNRVLDGYKLSVTGLNKYLRCPVTFYFESIVRVPMARTKYLGFGRAVHFALEQFHYDLNSKKEPHLNAFLTYFNKGMSDHRSHFTVSEHRDMSAYGHQVLKKYFEYYKEEFCNSNRFELEVKIENAECRGIPLKGVLDKVELRNGDVYVTDYKTGNPTSNYTKPKSYTPNDRNPLGGDYWRQIVFYKILLDSDRKHNWNMVSGIIDFIEPDKKTQKFIRNTISVSPSHINLVGDQIETVWNKIQNHEFEQGCDEDDCHWCNFVQNDYVFDMDLLEERMEDAINANE